MNACYKFATGRVQFREVPEVGGIMPSAVIVRIDELTGHTREAELLVSGDWYNGARVYREIGPGQRRAKCFT